MILKPFQSALILALLATSALQGCDHNANLTEQQLIQRAKDFEDKGNIKASVIELKNALQKNPNSPQARLLLGQIYLKAGLGAEAENELRKAQKLGVNQETITPLLGEALLQTGEYQRILEEIQPGERTSKPNLARIYQIRADALLNQGNLKDACNLFQRSLDTDTNNPPTYWGLAQCAVVDKDMSKARAWLDTALKIKDEQAKTWIFIGAWEQLNKNPQAALAAYDSAVKVDPNNLGALQNRVDLNISLGQLDAAKTDIEKIGKLAPKSLLAEYTQALLDFKLGKYPQARDALQNVFQITQDHMPSVLLAGATSYALGSYQQAESYLNRYLSNFPNQSYARRLLAATFIKQNQPNNALQTLAPIITPDSRDSQALALAGQAQYMAQNSTQATQYFDRAIALDPKNVAIRTQQGMNLLLSGNALGAINELEAATALDPNHYQADNLLIISLLQHKEYDKALAAIDAMEKKIPNNPATFNLQGNAYLGKQDWINARKSFEQALAIDPAFFPAAASLAKLDLRDKNPAAASKRFQNILDKDKNNLQAMMALAELASINKQEKDYIYWLKKAAETHPSISAPHVALARFYMSKKDPQQALAQANDAINANPNDPEALNLLGALQLATDDKINAIATFTKLTEKDKQSADAYLHLALAQMADAKLPDARVNLQKALQLKPDHLQSQDALLRLNMAENKPEDAMKIARQIETQRPQSPFGFEREGDILAAQKHLPQAAKAYSLALEKGAGSTGLIKLYQTYTLDGNAKAAEQVLSNWLKLHPGDNIVRGFAADHFLANGRNKEAIDLYETILKQSPSNVDASTLNNLATLYQRVNDSRALATAEAAMKLSPNNPAILDTTGWILVEQGQAASGLELLSKAVSLAPKVAAIRYHHAVALSRTGNNAQARKELEQLLRDSPRFTEIEAAKSLLKNL